MSPMRIIVTLAGRYRMSAQPKFQNPEKLANHPAPSPQFKATTLKQTDQTALAGLPKAVTPLEISLTTTDPAPKVTSLPTVML